MIKQYSQSFVPFYLITINGVKPPEKFNTRIISLEIQFEDEKADMITITFDNWDYSISNSPFITLRKKLSVVFGYNKDFVIEKDFEIRDYEGLEEFKIMAYRGEDDKKSKGSSSTQKNKAMFDNIGQNEVKDGTDVLNTTSSNTSSRQPAIPKAKWNAGAVMSVCYRLQKENNIIERFDPSVRTNNIPDSTSLETFDSDQKSFASSLIDSVGKKLGISDEIQSIKKGGAWIIDGITGAEKYIREKSSSLIEKVLPNDMNPFKNADDATGGIQGGNEITTEATMITLGVPKIRNGLNINVENVGIKFSGKWYIQSVNLMFNESGFKNEYKLLRPNHFTGGSGGSSNSSKNTNNNNSNNISIPKKKEQIIIDGVTGKEIIKK